MWPHEWTTAWMQIKVQLVKEIDLGLTQPQKIAQEVRNVDVRDSTQAAAESAEPTHFCAENQLII